MNEQIISDNEKVKGTLKPKKNKKKVVLILVLVLILLAAAAFGVYRLFFQQEELIALTGTTSYGALNEAIEGSGTTSPVDSVSYDVNGTVLEWCVEAGDEVKIGDLLYILDSSEAEDEILEYELELEELYEELSELQESVANQNVTAEFSGRIQDIKAEVGDRVQSGSNLAALVDDSTMKATLYFSYAYENDIAPGMAVTASVPEQMLNLSGSVSDVRYVDYVTTEGMRCFAVTISVDNPGSLTEGVTVSCWVDTANGRALYPATEAKLEYERYEQISSGASGELASVNVVDYQRVNAGDVLFTVDASGYESQIESLEKQIENFEEKIADTQEAIDTEYSRYSDIDGKVVSSYYSTNRMTGGHMGSVVIYNQDSMEISVNIDELDADLLTEGMDVYVYRTTSSRTESYPATLSYLSLEATSGSSGVSTFAATITIDSAGKLASGVTVYYSIDTSGGSGEIEETVLAPLNALCSYDDGYYLLIKSDTKPAEAIDPSQVGGSVTEYPEGYYAVPVEVGDFNGNYAQILSGAEEGQNVFLRYMNAAPVGGDITSNNGEEEGDFMMPGGFGEMPSFGGEGGMPSFGGEGGMPNFGGGGSGGGMPSFGGSGGGMPGGR